MLTDYMAVLELLTLMLAFYLTIAIMGIGFATMCAGQRGANAAARLFLLRPARFLAGGILALIVVILAGTWAMTARLVGFIAQTVWRELKELAADARWLLTGRQT